MTVALVLIVIALGVIAWAERNRHYRQARRDAWDQIEKDGSIQ